MEMKAFILHLKQHFITYLLLKMGGERSLQFSFRHLPPQTLKKQQTENLYSLPASNIGVLGAAPSPWWEVVFCPFFNSGRQDLLLCVPSWFLNNFLPWQSSWGTKQGWVPVSVTCKARLNWTVDTQAVHPTSSQLSEGETNQTRLWEHHLSGYSAAAAGVSMAGVPTSHCSSFHSSRLFLSASLPLTLICWSA